MALELVQPKAATGQCRIGVTPPNLTRIRHGEPNLLREPVMQGRPYGERLTLQLVQERPLVPAKIAYLRAKVGVLPNPTDESVRPQEG